MPNATDQLGKQADDVTEDLQKMAGTVRNAAEAKIGEVSDKAAEYGAQMQDKVHGVACACEQFVRERPLRSVLMAATIGWLLGRLSKGR